MVGVDKGHWGQAEVTRWGGQPTPMPIVAESPLSSTLSLRGWECRTGNALQMRYGSARGLTTRVQVGPGSGTDTIVLHSSTSMPSSETLGFAGWMLFTGSGKWKLAIDAPGESPASVVIWVN